MYPPSPLASIVLRARSLCAQARSQLLPRVRMSKPAITLSQF